MSGLRIYINTQTKMAVASETMPTPVLLPTLVRQNGLPLEIVLVEPRPGGGLMNPLQLVDTTELSIRVGMGSRSGLASGNPPVLQTEWVKDDSKAMFSGLLNMLTNEFEALFLPGNADQIKTWFEVTMYRAGVPTTIYQVPVNVVGNVLRVGLVAPSDAQKVDIITDALARAVQNSASIYWLQNGQGAGTNITKIFEHPYTLDTPLELERNKITAILAEVIWPPAGDTVELTGTLTNPTLLAVDTHYDNQADWPSGMVFTLPAGSEGHRITMTLEFNANLALPNFSVGAFAITSPTPRTELSFLYTGGAWTLQERTLDAGTDFTTDADLGLVELLGSGLVDDLEADSKVRFVFDCATAAQLIPHVRLDPDGGISVGPNGLYITAPALTVCDGSIHRAIPLLEANSQDGYVITAISEQTGYEAYKAFDRVENVHGWRSANYDTTLGQTTTWLAVQFPDPIRLGGFVIVNQDAETAAGVAYKMQGSSDGSTWTDLKVITEGNVQFNQPYLFLSPAEYEHYRIVFDYAASTGGYYSFLHELVLFEQLPTVRHTLSEENELCSDVLIDPHGEIEAGPNGMRLKALDELGTIPGGFYPSATKPDAVNNPRLRRYAWVDISKNPVEWHIWNPALGDYEKQMRPLTEFEGLVKHQEFEPNVAEDPTLLRHIWKNSVTGVMYSWVGLPTTGEWVSICDICGTGGGGYFGKLPNVVFNPANGATVPVNDIVLSVPNFTDVLIFYTLDGSTPAADESDTPTGTTALYDPDDRPDRSTAGTIKAMARKAGYIQSEISSAEYVAGDNSEWLLNINFRGNGTIKTGGAATFVDEFSDAWNNLTKPNSPTPGFAFVDETGNGLSNVSLTMAAWLDGNTYIYGTATNLDAMASTHIRSVDGFGRPVEYYFHLPPGVYDVYAYGHGPNNANETRFTAADQYGARAEENTATSGTAWQTTAWAEGVHYVLFPDMEPVSVAPVAADYFWKLGAVTLQVLHNAGENYLAGIQIKKKQQAPKVRFAPLSGYTFTTSQNVQLTCPGYPGAEIRYTDNGTTPTAGSTLYSAPINLTATKTIKAIAIVAGLANSAVNEATYTKI